MFFFLSRFIFNGFGFSRERQLIDSITQSQKQREIYSKTKTPANAEKIIHSCGVILLFLRLGTFFSSAVHVSRTASSSKGRIVLKEVILAAWDLHLQWLYHRVHTSWKRSLGFKCWVGAGVLSLSFVCSETVPLRRCNSYVFSIKRFEVWSLGQSKPKVHSIITNLPPPQKNL